MTPKRILVMVTLAFLALLTLQTAGILPPLNFPDLAAALPGGGGFDPDALSVLAAGAAFGTIRTRILPTANSVASGKTATIDLPIGIKYHSVGLTIGYDGSNASKETAGTAANQVVNDIRVLINGKLQRLHSLKQLNAINIANGSQYAIRTSGSMGSSGYREYIKIFLSEPWRKDIRQQAMGAWNMNPADVRSFQVQVDFATITSPVLSGYYEFEELGDARLGGILKWIRQTFPAVGSSVEAATIQRPVGDFLQALQFFATSDGKYVNQLKLTVNGAQVQEEIDYLTQRARLFGWDLNPDTNAYSTTNYLSPRFDLPFDVDDPIAQAIRLELVRELTFKATLDSAASGTLDVMVGRIGAPD